MSNICKTFKILSRPLAVAVHSLAVTENFRQRLKSFYQFFKWYYAGNFMNIIATFRVQYTFTFVYAHLFFKEWYFQIHV